MGVFVLIKNIFYDATIILQFEEPLFILITFFKPHCIFVLKKLHFAVFMGESLSPPVYIHLFSVEQMITVRVKNFTGTSKAHFVLSSESII